MAVTWSLDLTVGIVEIDIQHHELFEHVQNLVQACEQGSGVEYLGAMITFLDTYAGEHFDTEEHYMIQYGYPNLAYHRAQHEAFRRNLADLKSRLKSEGPGQHLLGTTYALVSTWLKTHIREVDKPMAAFLNARRASAK